MNKTKKGYATVVEEDGAMYRDIAETMTDIGFKMNHSSARNYVIRVMRKFVIEFCRQQNLHVNESQVDSIAKSPLFQQGIAEMLHIIEAERK